MSKIIKKAEKIQEIIKDYRNDDNIFITSDDIISWAYQFDENAEFVLDELGYILPQIYISKDKAKSIIKKQLMILITKYKNIQQFLSETEFLNLQYEYKSQSAILKLLEDILNEDYQESYLKYQTFPKKHFVYFDDVLATGNTIGKEITQWLNTKDKYHKKNIEYILNDEYKLVIGLFCIHTWGYEFLKYKLKKTFEDVIDNKIKWLYEYKIENHLKFNNQSLNIAIPINTQDIDIQVYLKSLQADKYEDYAFRLPTKPVKEIFFSNSENRIKYENIILQKGLEIIKMIKGKVSSNIRPLGLINPSYKTFGLGTHFFTWRNIPNNSPLVFWWDVTGHTWIPLFPITNRGF
ncbi:MAG: hypothetical protein MUC49_15005 [Raineya sp.]|jgi:hypothetical protein|nr:hypothetical protein [Raineya sp.]